MIELIRRSLVGVSVIAPIAALAALVPGNAAVAAGGHPSVGRPVHWFAGVRPKLDPMGRAKPAAAAPDLTPGQASPWKALKNSPPFDPGTMLLASDGTVLVHAEPPAGGTSKWFKLTPDSKGSYVNGTWSQLPSMPGGYNPLYFASAILPDGRMIVEGGKYLGGIPTWTNKGAIYNPVTNTNFPLVRITNNKSGVVTYARTSNWTSVSIAPGASSSTQFTVPSTTPTGRSTLVVVANGIASSPVPVTIR